MIALLLLRAAMSDSVEASDSLPGAVDVRPMAPTVVVGARRGAIPAAVDSAAWRAHSVFGQSGPVDVLRDLPGVSGQGELSGKFSTEGIPEEGTAITWDGAEIPWPWHFGGIFGALDQAAVGQAAWDPSGGAASPACGGGWLRTRSRAATGTEGVHGEVELGTVSGALGAWGGVDGFSWQATARRTWIDPALRFARDRGWTDQGTDLMFWDGTAALGWVEGPWRLHAGFFRSKDTVSLGEGLSSGGVEESWTNTAFPVGLAWVGEAMELSLDGSWSRLSLAGGDPAQSDTLDLLSGSIQVRRRISDGVSIEAGLRERRWKVGHRQEWRGLPGFLGDRDRLFQEPHVGMRLGGEGFWSETWGGFGLDRRDPDAPEGGISAGACRGRWSVRLDLTHRLLPLGTREEVSDPNADVVPARYLPPGPSTRSDLLQLDLARSMAVASTDPAGGFELLAWVRTLDGIWSFERTGSDASLAGDQPEIRTVRSDGGSWGADLSMRGAWGRAGGGFRQALSWNVLRRRPDEGGTHPIQWAPWDQRWQTEIDACWSWKGGATPRPGAFFMRTRAAFHGSSGIQRPAPGAWSMAGTGQVVEHGWEGDPILSWRVPGARRATYSRVDLTPIEVGRAGSWQAWWSIANLLNARNAVGWFQSDPGGPVEQVDQIPFLPVVLGVRLQF